MSDPIHDFVMKRARIRRRRIRGLRMRLIWATAMLALSIIIVVRVFRIIDPLLYGMGCMEQYLLVLWIVLPVILATIWWVLTSEGVRNEP